MSMITYHHENGHSDLIRAVAGTSVMRAAVINGVEGIIGECGGQAMCATCHVYVREEFLDLLPEMSDDEEEMLEITASPRDAVRSRLGCQLKITTSLNEIAVDVPPTQVQ
ncbi:2Fe-2S iron-sulfur cluster binding domain-containing protein [Cryobacterium lyxosi]|uniref:2Fe-2S iron-sulfur cluster binding domain-containing protein n=2 Tax=Cryobacterium lyxosi TaxID=1259228 RepID=A0A4R8ZGY2_9MICO|nr:2Fe-2S iron-sulfur cluster-binding protein [Cryobacterium lyxosi]TFD27740.1 2Fe-2S iron-sulfur cluster binding domain-containing protein [Cryobacterium lyxosi]